LRIGRSTALRPTAKSSFIVTHFDKEGFENALKLRAEIEGKWAQRHNKRRTSDGNSLRF
jgi:hypothetical protein